MNFNKVAATVTATASTLVVTIASADAASLGLYEVSGTNYNYYGEKSYVVGKLNSDLSFFDFTSTTPKAGADTTDVRKYSSDGVVFQGTNYPGYALFKGLTASLYPTKPYKGVSYGLHLNAGLAQGEISFQNMLQSLATGSTRSILGSEQVGQSFPISSNTYVSDNYTITAIEGYSSDGAEAVPEPGEWLGMAVIGLTFGGMYLKKRKTAKM